MAMTCEDDANGVVECARTDGAEERELARLIGQGTLANSPAGPAWLPAVEAVPLDVFPELMARLAREIGHTVGCDPGLPAGTMLSIAGGLIGRSARLVVRPWQLAGSTILYAGVGWPGSGKAQSQVYAIQPAREIERELAEEFELEEMSDDWVGRRPLASGDEENRYNWAPAAVKRWRAVVDGGTVESWLRILARRGNERGILVVSEDISRLGLNVQGIGRGSSRQALMRIWSNLTVNMDQSRDAPDDAARIVEPQISIAGCVTPEMLRAMHNPKRDDGLLDHWLFVFADRSPKPKLHERREVSGVALEGWGQIAKRLWALDLKNWGRDGSGPAILRRSEDGQAAFDARHDRHVEEMNAAGFTEYLRGPWAKLDTYAGRFWLILSLLHQAADLKAERGTIPVASKEAAVGAWRLVDYFKSHARRVYSWLHDARNSGPPRGARSNLRRNVGPPRGAQLILRWISNHRESEVVSFGELTRDYSSSNGYDREMLIQGMCWLEQHRVLQVVVGGEDAGKRGSRRRGRPRRRLWEIHRHLTLELARE